MRHVSSQEHRLIAFRQNEEPLEKNGAESAAMAPRDSAAERREMKNGLEKGTWDQKDRKGLICQRRFDPGKPGQYLNTYLYDPDDQLIDEKRLKSMSPKDLDELFTEIANEEDPTRRSAGIDATYTAFDHLLRCNRSEELFRAIVLQDPKKALSQFGIYANAPFALSIAEEAAGSIKDHKEAGRLLQAAATSLPPAQKQKVVELAKKVDVRGGIASDILSKDRLPDRGALLKDPALEHLTRLQDEWIDWKGVLPSGLPAKEKGIWKAQMKAMVARNLYFQDIDFSKGAVEKEVQRIQEARKQYKDIELFRGRSVVHIAPAEGRAPRFGTKATQESLAYQQDGKGTYEFLRSSPKVTKEAILQKIRMTPSPATFVFDMDGSDAGKDQQAIYLTTDTSVLSGKKIDPSLRITAEELAHVFQERAKQVPSKGIDPRTKDICIFATCFNSNFTRSFYGHLGDSPLPIALGESEYGQYGHSDRRNPYGGVFFSDVLQLKRNVSVRQNVSSPSRASAIAAEAAKKPTTFGDVFEQEFQGDSNPSLYIPGEKNVPMQISKEGTSFNRKQTKPENRTTS
jgi:hypothetical protein